MTFATTTIPNAITALLAVIEAAVPTGTQVSDGAPVEYTAPNAVYIDGWTSNQAPASLAASPSFQVEEDYEIEGTIRAYQGDVDQAASRTTAFALFKAIQTGIRADPRLGGAVRVAWITKNDGAQGGTDIGGVATEIDFAVHCEARISS